LHHADPDAPAARILKNLEQADRPLVERIALDLSRTPSGAPGDERQDGASPDEHAQLERAWQEIRAAAIGRLTSARVVTPTELVPADVDGAARALASDPAGLAWEDDGVDLGATGDFDPDAAPSPGSEPVTARIGRAVHAALVEIDRGGAVVESATQAAIEAGAGVHFREVLRLVRAVRNSPEYRCAVESARRWFEVPVGAEIDGVLLDGRIDLLWELADGTLGIVDVKTDQVDLADAQSRAEFYRSQVGAYALAVEAVTRRKVSRVEILFAALGGLSIQFEDVEALIREVRALIGPRR
jgi:hypothetical protein